MGCHNLKTPTVNVETFLGRFFFDFTASRAFESNGLNGDHWLEDPERDPQRG